MVVDGSMSLDDQQKSLHFQELTKPCLLTSLEKGDPTQNTATFNEIPLGQNVPELFLVAIVSPATLQSVKNDQQTKGRKIIFNSSVYVGGQEASVAGFR